MLETGRRNRGKSGDWETFQTIWGGTGGPTYSLAPGNSSLLIIAGIVPALAPAGTVPLGRMIVDEIEASIDILGGTSGVTTCCYGIGFYIAEWSTSTTAWSTQSPLIATDACRDNWIAIETGTAVMQFPPSITQNGIKTRWKLKGPWQLRQGEAIMQTVQNDGFSQGAFNWNSFTRYRVRRVS